MIVHLHFTALYKEIFAPGQLRLGSAQVTGSGFSRSEGSAKDRFLEEARSAAPCII